MGDVLYKVILNGHEFYVKLVLNGSVFLSKDITKAMNYPRFTVIEYTMIIRNFYTSQGIASVVVQTIPYDPNVMQNAE